MKRTLLVATALLAGSAAYAQQALGPASGITSPEIHPDHTVTFRYRAPKAVTVQLQGDFLPGRVDMKEGRAGMWTYTTEPLTGELYSYSFQFGASSRDIRCTATAEAAAAETPAHRVLLMK